MQRSVKVRESQRLEQSCLILGPDFASDDIVAIEDNESLNGASIVLFNNLHLLNIPVR